LNGYPSKEETPDYRILRHIPSYGNFMNIAWKASSQPIPMSSIPEDLREGLDTLYLVEPISFYSSLVNKKSDEPTINFGWNADLIAYLGDKIIDGFHLTNAWRAISTSSLVAFIDTVKNRILDFVLEIEAEAPNAGETSSGDVPIPEERVQQLFFNTVILGGSAQIAGGNQKIEHKIDVKVVQNDFDSLRRFLTSLQVGEDDILELGKAIQEDEKSEKETGFGEKVQVWLGKMITKAASGSWKIATAVAANLLTKALMQYYGN
jgi:hypothetical protein